VNASLHAATCADGAAQYDFHDNPARTNLQRVARANPLPCESGKAWQVRVDRSGNGFSPGLEQDIPEPLLTNYSAVLATPRKSITILAPDLTTPFMANTVFFCSTRTGKWQLERCGQHQRMASLRPAD